MVKKKDIIDSNEQLSDQIGALAKALKKNNDESVKSNKKLAKVVAGITQVNKVVEGARKSWHDAFSRQDDLVKLFVGFGRTFEVQTQNFAGIMKNNTTTFTESFKAVSEVFKAGIVKNTAGVIKLNEQMNIMGKDTKSLTKLIAIQNQVFRMDTQKTTTLVASMIESALQYGVNTDRLLRGMMDLTDTMQKLRFSLGPQFDIQLAEAFKEVTQDYGPEAAEVWKTMMVDYLSDARKLMIATGGLGRFDMASKEGMQALGQSIARHSGLVGGRISGSMGDNIAKLQVFNNQALLGQMGITPAALAFFEVMKGGKTRGKLDTKTLGDRIGMATEMDFLRTLNVLFKQFSGALIPVVHALTSIVRGNLFGSLQTMMGKLTIAIYNAVVWINSNLAQLGMNVNLPAHPGSSPGGGGQGGTGGGSGGSPGSMPALLTRYSQGKNWDPTHSDRSMIGSQAVSQHFNRAAFITATGAATVAAKRPISALAAGAFEVYSARHITQQTMNSAMVKASTKGTFKLAQNAAGKKVALRLGLDVGQEYAEDVFLNRVGQAGLGSFVTGQGWLTAAGRTSRSNKLTTNTATKLLGKPAGAFWRSTGGRVLSTVGKNLFTPKAVAKKMIPIVGYAGWAEFAYGLHQAIFATDDAFAQAAEDLAIQDTLGAEVHRRGGTHGDIQNLAHMLENQNMGRWQDIAATISMQYKSYGEFLRERATTIDHQSNAYYVDPNAALVPPR